MQHDQAYSWQHERTYSTSQSCLLTGQSYNQLMRRIFRREIRACQDEAGRWHLSAADVDQLAERLRRVPTPAA